MSLQALVVARRAARRRAVGCDGCAVERGGVAARRRRRSGGRRRSCVALWATRPGRGARGDACARRCWSSAGCWCSSCRCAAAAPPYPRPAGRVSGRGAHAARRRRPDRRALGRPGPAAVAAARGWPPRSSRSPRRRRRRPPPRRRSTTTHSCGSRATACTRWRWARCMPASSSPATSASRSSARRCCGSRSVSATCTRASSGASRNCRSLDGHRLAARVSGDSAVAYSWAYCQALEGLAGATPCRARAPWLRALALELERHRRTTWATSARSATTPASPSASRSSRA